MRKLSFQIAFGGIISALCIILMFSVGLFPALVYVFPMICSLLIFAMDYECGKKTAIACYLSVALLSLILSPDKESALLFLTFFGYYPIILVYLEKIKSAVLRWIIKLMIFNAAMILSYYLLIAVFGLIEAEDNFKLLSIIMLAAGNMIFVIYDKMLKSMYWLYIKRIRKKLFKRK